MKKANIWELYSGKRVYIPYYNLAPFLLQLWHSRLFGSNSKIQVTEHDKGVLIKSVK